MTDPTPAIGLQRVDDRPPIDVARELFTNRPPDEQQADTLDEITAAMVTCAATLLDVLPPSRFRSLAMTQLEQASMWAKKAAVFTTGETLHRSP